METSDDPPRKTSRATILRRVLVALLALACAGGWIYTRYLVVKHALGEPCSYDIHCKPDAPRCLKQAVDAEGVCSRPCDTDADCAVDIRCVKVELEELDDRGRPLQGGYCFPQTLLDARRKRLRGDAGAVRTDAWLDVPDAPGQLEGEITMDRGGAKTTYEVKGTLVRASRPHGRTIVDTSTLRVYSVEDEKKTFSASQLAAGPGEPRVTKTERRDRVADRECEIWQIEEAGASTREACVVKGAAFVDPGARTVSAWEKELTVRGVFPLRVSEGGKTQRIVTKIDAKPLDAARFSIPKAYKNLAAR
jgi:hypothetical protein